MAGGVCVCVCVCVWVGGVDIREGAEWMPGEDL